MPGAAALLDADADALGGPSALATISRTRSAARVGDGNDLEAGQCHGDLDKSFRSDFQRAYHQPIATFASSDMRSGDQGGSNTMFTLTPETPGNRADGVLHPARHLAGDRAARRGQRHVDGDLPVVVDVDLVDQAELVDVGRDFRVVDRLQRRDDVGRSAAPAPPAGMRRRRRRRACSARLLGVPGHGRPDAAVCVAHGASPLKRRKNGPSPGPRQGASTSSRVLYRPNEARQVEVTP